MPKEEEHWIIKRLEYLRKEAKKTDFSSGTNRRRKDLIELLATINDFYEWWHSIHVQMSDNGATGKIILTPKYEFNKDAGKIILEYPSIHNTHRMVFILFETPAAQKAAAALRKVLAEETFAFEFALILKQGRRLIAIDPA